MPRFKLKHGELAHTLNYYGKSHKLYAFRPGTMIEVDASDEASLKFLRGWGSPTGQVLFVHHFSLAPVDSWAGRYVLRA